LEDVTVPSPSFYTYALARHKLSKYTLFISEMIQSSDRQNQNWSKSLWTSSPHPGLWSLTTLPWTSTWPILYCHPKDRWLSPELMLPLHRPPLPFFLPRKHSLLAWPWRPRRLALGAVPPLH
jgi:hypothetical protein